MSLETNRSMKLVPKFLMNVTQAFKIIAIGYKHFLHYKVKK